MPTITLQGVRNANRVLDNLDNISDILRKPMDRSLLRLANRMAVYPPPPPGSTYRRTGTYGRRWTTATRDIPTVTATRIEGRIGNNTSYGPWVGSAQFQSRVHRNRWTTDEQVAREEESWISDQFSEALNDAVE